MKKEAVCGASFLVGSRLLSQSKKRSQTGRLQQQTGSSRFRGWEGPAQGAAELVSGKGPLPTADGCLLIVSSHAQEKSHLRCFFL